MAIVKAGSRYFYNNTSGAVYPWSHDLEKISGLLLFVPATSGTFELSMTLKGSAEPVVPVQKAVPMKTEEQRTAAAKAATERAVANEAEQQAKAQFEAAVAAKEAQDKEAAIQAAMSVSVPTAAGASRIPTVNLTHSDFNQE